MEEHHEPTSPDDRKPVEYEPPEVERVLDADELTREVHYAGGDGIPPIITIS